MEQERRLRREIANSNERRRMQSINAGFQSLRTLLPHHEGEKLSKAAILQQTAEYIYQLEQEKTRLLSQNCHLKRLVQQHQHLNADSDGGESPLPKRKKGDASPGGHLTEITDEGLGSMSPDRSSDEPSLDDLKSDLIELRLQLERERGLRKLIEEQLRSLKTQICSSKIREVPSQVHGQMKKSLDHCDPHFSDSVIKSEPLGTDPSDGCLATVTIPCLVETGNIASDDSSSNSSCITGSQSITATVSSVGGDCMIPEIPEERVPSTTEFTINEESGPRTIYVTNTSRQNLETIVEAIRHLEGDHLFGDDGVGREEVIEIETQDMPLELTAKSTSDTAVSCLAPGEMDCYKTELHGSESSRHVLCAPLLSNRPGVIVVKHQL